MPKDSRRSERLKAQEKAKEELNKVTPKLKGVRKTASTGIKFATGFRIPTALQTLEDLRSPHNTHEKELQLLIPLFQSVPLPCSQDDWLAQYADYKESFKHWRSSRAKYREESKNTIYLVWVHENAMSSQHIKLMNAICEYVAAFYNGIQVKIAKEIKIDKSVKGSTVTYNVGHVKLRQRIAHPYDIDKVEEPDKEKQFAVDPLLRYLAEYKRERYPDCICLLGLTMEDLYEGSKDSFVAGMAAGGDHIGLFSFCRYDPTFRSKKANKNSIERQVEIDGQTWTENELLLMKRGCKIAVHELAHMFQIDHCVYFSCCMNGSGHLEEDFRQSIHICPVDLGKLLHETKSDIVDYYSKLKDFFVKYQMEQESRWVQDAMSIIQKHRESQQQQKTS